MIDIQDVSKNFGPKQVLQHISLQFLPGHVYGIVGENGAGKTTLFRCIAGLESYDGVISAIHTPLQHHLGVLFTEPYFFNKITGEEYIRLLCNARGVILPDIKQQNVFDLPLQQYASTYSTGMKKKLALTAVLLQGNEYLILDEPFNGVDIQSNILITGIIEKLRALGKCVIISSHIFSTLEDTCDEIHLLHEGRIQQSVKKDEFALLEDEMKRFSIGNKIERLMLR